MENALQSLLQSRRGVIVRVDAEGSAAAGSLSDAHGVHPSPAPLSRDESPPTTAPVMLGEDAPPPALRILLSTIVGSRAYGLDTDASDTDRRGLYTPSPDLFLGLTEPPQQLVHDADQLCYWEAGKAIRLALAANPTVLEMLFSPIVEFASPAGQRLLEIRENLLSQRVHRTFLGYAEAQFEKLDRARRVGNTFRWQHAMHLIRLLRTGERLLRTGRLELRATPEEREELLSIKRGEHDWNDVVRMRERWSHAFLAAADRTPLPPHPDVRLAEAWLLETRLAQAAAYEGLL